MVANNSQSLVRRFFIECWNQGNLDLLEDLLAPEHIHHLPGRDLHGPAQIKQLITRVRSQFPDFYITMENEITSDDKVVVRWMVRGTDLGGARGQRQLAGATNIQASTSSAVRTVKSLNFGASTMQKA